MSSAGSAPPAWASSWLEVVSRRSVPLDDTSCEPAGSMRLVVLVMLAACCFLPISAEPRSQLRRGRRLVAITDEQMDNVETDPWVPCQKGSADGGGVTRGFCRLECVSSYSYTPGRMECEMLDPEPLIARSFAVGASAFRELSENSFSKVAPPARRTPPVLRCSKVRLPPSPRRSTRVRRIPTTPMWARCRPGCGLGARSGEQQAVSSSNRPGTAAERPEAIAEGL